MPRLLEKTAFLTGAGTGIGRACAMAFAREGAKIAIVGRRVGPLHEVAQEVGKASGHVLPIACDVTDVASVERALAKAETHFGQLNVVVNNAGAVVVATAEQTTDADWQNVLGVNLTGTFNVSRAALPILRRAGGGSIVNIGSVLGLVARRERAAYCAAKAGVTGLTKAMALDHAQDKIRVNCICPSIVETELGIQSMAKAADPAADRVERAKQIPLGRLGMPEDVAELAVYLASDEAAWMTGAAIPIDGGLTAY
ncbi:MAG TPA: SDR family NAD(P)-dependent oxidoreductase [Candidatus Acidoferrum sp.]|nr:SDR family NAD(P)-dependent oxidoreductase [Candidatus Acidoferrum sp.]